MVMKTNIDLSNLKILL